MGDEYDLVAKGKLKLKTDSDKKKKKKKDKKKEREQLERGVMESIEEAQGSSKPNGLKMTKAEMAFKKQQAKMVIYCQILLSHRNVINILIVFVFCSKRNELWTRQN